VNTFIISLRINHLKLHSQFKARRKSSGAIRLCCISAASAAAALQTSHGVVGSALLQDDCKMVSG